MAITSYIPAADADFSAWLGNFNVQAQDTPAVFGFSASETGAIIAAQTAWELAYTAAVDPITRSAVSIAAKDAARVAAEQTVRPLAVRVSQNVAIDNDAKVRLGVTVRKVTPSPVPAPTTTPLLSVTGQMPGSVEFGYRDSATPTSKAKPPGVLALELRGTFGTAPAVSPDVALPLGNFTKSPLVVSVAGKAGQVLTVWGRWGTRSGSGGKANVGPWSVATSVVCS